MTPHKTGQGPALTDSEQGQCTRVSNSNFAARAETGKHTAPVRFATFATNAGVSPETSVDVGGCRPSRHDFVMIEFFNYEKRISDSIPNSLALRLRGPLFRR